MAMHSVADLMHSYGEAVQREGTRAARAIVALDNTNDPEQIVILRARARDAVAECRLTLKVIRKKLKEFERTCDSCSG